MPGLPARINGLIPVAQYNRMSTDLQDCSIPTQQEWNREFAARNGMEIVETYADEGQSGVSVRGRDALKRLLENVQNHTAEWKAILVYDVTRWGRFQDPDEAAYYEFACKLAGYPVIYTAEAFNQIEGPFSSLIKHAKRAEAGDFSRVLGVKTFAAQKRLVKQGFWCSGYIGYGFRRATTDKDGKVLRILAHGEWNAQNRHTRIVLGPPREVEAVREVFRLFADEGLSVSEIFTEMNARGIPGGQGRPWNRQFVYLMLRHERYLGTNVWGKKSGRLQTRVVKTPPEQWIRAEDAFPTIIDRPTFDKAQKRLDQSKRLDDKNILDGLRKLLRRKQRLSGDLINVSRDLPALTTLRRHFGNMTKIYALIGFRSERRVYDMAAHRAAKAKCAALGAEIVRRLQDAGAAVSPSPDHPKRLMVNETLTVSYAALLGHLEGGRNRMWMLVRPASPCPDFMVFARLSDQGTRILDYYIVPSEAMVTCNHFKRVGQKKKPSPLEQYRRPDLSDLPDMLRLSGPLEDEIEGLDDELASNMPPLSAPPDSL